MKLFNTNLLFALSLTLCLNAKSSAQSLADLRKQFPQTHAVMLNKALHYKISVKGREPYVESEELQQIQYLTPQTAAYMGRFGFSHSDFQQLVSYEAYTRTPEAKKLKVVDFKTSISKADFVFYDDQKETTFDFPSVQEGSVGSLHVSWINKNPYLLTPFYFAGGLPAVNSELELSFPKDMVIKYRIFGLDSTKVEFTAENNRKETKYKFRYHNCEPERPYNDAPPAPWYATHVVFYIDSYKDDLGNTVHYLSGLDDLYRLNYGFVKSINQQVSPEIKCIVDSLTAGRKTDETKARAIYSWVQHQIKYVAFEEGMEGFVPREANLVCTRRFGDCKDMSSILTVMMKAAGIKAFYTWLGTRHLPYLFSQLPLPMVSNHMICTIDLDGKYIFLDGTDPNCIFGYPPEAIQNKEAMIAINEKEYKILKVPVIDKSFSMLTDSTWLELSEQGIVGNIKRVLTGYYAMNMHSWLQYTPQTDLKERMRNMFNRGSNKFQLDSFSLRRNEDPNLVEVSSRFRLPDYAKKIGNEWYLNLNLFKFYLDEEIEYPKRKMPIEYDFKSVRTYVTLLKLPNGWKVSDLPENKSFHNSVWGFDLKYEVEGDYVVLTQQFDSDQIMLTSDQFEQSNKVLEYLYPQYKKTLTLLKNPAP
jgi:hypothetical protein